MTGDTTICFPPTIHKAMFLQQFCATFFHQAHRTNTKELLHTCSRVLVLIVRKGPKRVYFFLWHSVAADEGQPSANLILVCYVVIPKEVDEHHFFILNA